MKEIHLGQVLTKKRRRLGITQDELALYMGVSKAAVSKWETGTTYPDITLLPRLAGYFHISIDELMGYTPQMTREEIRKLYRQLSEEFASQPIGQVLVHCREIAEKYASCFPLLYQIGSLYVNYGAMAGEQEKTRKIYEDARELFKRVKTGTDDIDLAKQALNMEALCMLLLNRPKDVLDLLGQPDCSMTAPEPLLASAYQMLGSLKQAEGILQTGIYYHMLVIMNLFSVYLGLCLDDAGRFHEIYQKAMHMSAVFGLEKLHPGMLLSFYLTASRGFMKLGDTEKALEVLEQYALLAAGNIYPLHLKGDRFFDLIDNWLEHTLVLGDALPRDSRTIQKSLVDAVEHSRVFLPLQNHPQFQGIIRRLKSIAPGNADKEVSHDSETIKKNSR